MPEVVPHVIATERKHSHGVTADLALRAFCRGGHLRSHGCAYIDPRTPIECLKYQWHGAGPTAAKNDGADGNPVWIFPRWVNCGTLGRGCRKSCVRMRSFGSRLCRDLGSPPGSLP